MSRLIVKNLPKNITEEKLKQLFSEKGIVTDIQLKYTKDGKFRQFAFVGYQNEDQASAAIEYYDKMCIQTHRLTVARCATLGDTDKPKPWSKYAPEITAHNAVNQTESKDTQVTQSKSNKKKKATNLLEKYKADPLFKEFMQVHAPKETHLLEENNEETVDKESEEEEENSEENEVEDTNKLACQKISDAEYLKGLMKDSTSKSSLVEKIAKTEKPAKEKIKLYTVKLRGLPYACKKKDIKQFFSPLVPYTIRLPPKIKGIAYVGFKNEKQMKKALIKDKSFITGRRVFVLEYKGQEEKSEETIDPKKKKWKNQEEQVKNEESIAESGRIFLRNLSYTVTENDIQELFTKYGPLTEINVPIDPVSRQMKGFGTVTFLMPEHAVKAYTELDGSILHGRMLHLLPGKAKDTPDPQLDSESSNYKQKKLAKQKAAAGSSHNWNSLFLGHDAVAGAIADSFGVSKEDVLAPHGDGSAAVRLALGETQIVAATRKYLEQEGVILDAFSTPGSKRSKTVILVKNLPSKTEAREIRELFEKHGVLGRVILPPSGITAIVEFMEPSEARKAFLKLSYSKFKNMPMYLEWAPEDTLTENQKSTEKVHKKEEVKPEVPETAKSNDDDGDDDEEPEENTTIFVKNLNFETTDENLKKHFETCGKVHYAKVATKRDKNNPNNKLSMGFGFVQFKLKTSADKALKTLQQSSLDGKSLELKRSERTLKDEVKAVRKTAKSTKQTGTKILVRNVPFQASKKEISELFRTFGEIKALRMPKKINPGSESHRGFAFVDYVTESDAKAAFEALCQSTHLYGRRLVLEWAAVSEDVTQIRKRTADHFQQSEKPKSKKSVFDIV